MKGLSVSDVYTFDSDLPKEKWTDQWHMMTHQQVKAAQDPNSKYYYPKDTEMISIITLKKTSVYLLKWVLNAIGCLSHGQEFSSW